MKSKFSFVLSVFSVVLFSCTDVDLTVSTEKEAIEILGLAMQSPESDEAIQIANTVIDAYLSTVPNQTPGASKVAKMVALPYVEKISKEGIYPESYVIDFGDGYYMDSSRRTVRGKIYFTKSDKTGKERRYYFSEFYLDKVNIKSYRTIVRKAEYELEITAKDTVTIASGEVYYRNWNRTRKLIDSNGNVSEYWNNSYEYDGTATGTTLSKTKYKMHIQKPLVSLGDYKYYVSGVVSIATDRGEQSIDFGNGEKDNVAIISINGKENKVELNWEK